MNKDWQEKMASLGAVVDPDGNISFEGSDDANRRIGAHALNEAPLLVDLSHLRLVEFSGADAQTFLQAQVCNDLTALSDNELQINGYCTPKGRLLALFTVFAHGDGYRLLLPHDVAPAFVKRLQMFVMRAEVTVELRTDLVCTGIVLDAAQTANDHPLTDILPVLPATPMSISTNAQMQLLRWHDVPSDVPSSNALSRYLCIAEADAMWAVWQRDGLEHASWSYWRWGDINAGIPNVYAASAEQFIPQMLNMHLINALSFKKGCYPGQEIVARMQYLGKLKKHMKHLRIAGATQVAEPGDTLTTDANNNAGQVVDAVLDEDGLNLLAVVNIETPVSELRLAGAEMQLAAMPYELEPVPETGL